MTQSFFHKYQVLPSDRDAERAGYLEATTISLSSILISVHTE